MRRNHNRNLTNRTNKVSTIDTGFAKIDKREINKEVKDGFFKNALSMMVGFGKRLWKVFWGSNDKPAMTFNRPVRKVVRVPSRVIKRRKALRRMQRNSRRANRK